MTIRFQLNFDDLMALQQDVINNSHTHDIKEKYFKWVTSIVLFLVVLFLMKISLITVTISLLIAIIYFFITPFLYTNMAFFKLKKQMERNDYSHVLGDCEMTFSEAGIDRKIKDATTHFDWHDFETWREDTDHYFLYVSDLQGVIVSKEPDEMNEREAAAYHERIRQYAGELINNE